MPPSSVLISSLILGSAQGFVVQGGALARSQPRMMAGSATEEEPDRRSFFQRSATGAAAITGSSWLGGVPSSHAAKSTAWTQVNVGVDTTLFDIAFDSGDPNHGYVVGAKGTFLETTDGGKNWFPRSFTNLDAEEEINYRFEKVSFKDNEAWIIGKPAILLHSKDGGKNWERVPLSPKLPGEPNGVVALGPSQAEMTTTTGAIYYTENAGRNWKAKVKETIDATLNRISSSGVSGASYFTGSISSIQRDGDGAYLSVSSRGNFYLTWLPGDEFWIPHNRATPRRIQSMGFINKDLKKGLWMTLNGGVLQFSSPKFDLNEQTPEFEQVQIKTGGYGIIDLGWKNAQEIWAVGGGGTMYVSKDGGKSFKFDDSADDIPGNLYSVKFFEKTGFVLGSDGVLLRYTA